jgi:hypothetical protein
MRVLVIRNDDIGIRRSGPNHARTADVWALAFDYSQKFAFRKKNYVRGKKGCYGAKTQLTSVLG